ncbi:MAG: uracil-xanthine permease [Emergencia sp.]|jgi:uracil permease|uniref:uracil-xanthine permease family protein n=1 Tax=Anaerovoracaceae TaxID=543314 RepID=UPI0013794349|nr:MULTISPECIES: uracil-xanthine permease family protein [Clostridia]MCI9476758.1 uracil-xanthine permease [Emergencia sp.]NCF00087.1 uracil-xanthine permease [Emergencia sp. 1XD21-10]
MTEKETLADGIYDASSLGMPKMLILGLQHTFAMFGATILVPILTGLDVSVTLLMAGLGTLLFHLLTKGKVPAFLGSSFAFLGGYAAVAPMVDGTPNEEMLPYACGGVFAAGIIYVIMAALIKAFGARRVMRFFPPVVTGPIIISIGLILAPTAITNCQTNWPLALIALLSIIIFNIWGKGMVKIIPIILGVIISYIAAIFMGEVDLSAISEEAIIGLPHLTVMKFDISAIITIMPIALATMMEHIGDISAIGATTGKNYISNPGLHRTLLGDGLATCLSSAFGGPANTTYGENTGVLALTKIYDPRVVRIAACFAILLSFIPKISFAISSIPAAVIGGVSLILYGMISAIGIRNVVENQVDFTKSRNTIIAALILVCALGFNAAGGISFTIAGATITLSGLAIAAIVGIVANAILPGNDYEFSEEEGTEEKFQTFKL